MVQQNPALSTPKEIELTSLKHPLVCCYRSGQLQPGGPRLFIPTDNTFKTISIHKHTKELGIEKQQHLDAATTFSKSATSIQIEEFFFRMYESENPMAEKIKKEFCLCLMFPFQC